MARLKDKQKVFQRPRGTHDILPEEQHLWDSVRDAARAIAGAYGFGRIDTPHIEDTDLFYVGVGKATDIVSKQMYSFKTRGGDALTLRPEGTAAIARAFVENGMMNLPQPVKLYYLGSFFRHEAPQRGRFREFHQWGIELLGEEHAVADGEIILVFYTFLSNLGIKDATVEVNSIGCPLCRASYRGQLTQYYRGRVRGLCRDCKDRFRENPLRLLDCTEEKCAIVKKTAPQLLDRLCEACRNHFKMLLEFLEEASVPYVLNPHLVRGLDYYTRTVFEIFIGEEAKKSDGAENKDTATAAKEEPQETPKRLALGGGGRYDGLVELVGGKATPAVGAAMGLERLVAVLKSRELDRGRGESPDVFLVQLGDLARKKSFRVMESLRRAGITFVESLGRDSIRSQLKIADRVSAAYALILGQKEALDGMIILREMKGGGQETISQDRLIETLKRKLHG